jgi:hypothetical protein
MLPCAFSGHLHTLSLVVPNRCQPQSWTKTTEEDNTREREREREGGGRRRRGERDRGRGRGRGGGGGSPLMFSAMNVLRISKHTNTCSGISENQHDVYHTTCTGLCCCNLTDTTTELVNYGHSKLREVPSFKNTLPFMPHLFICLFEDSSLLRIQGRGLRGMARLFPALHVAGSRQPCCAGFYPSSPPATCVHLQLRHQVHCNSCTGFYP